MRGEALRVNFIECLLLELKALKLNDLWIVCWLDLARDAALPIAYVVQLFRQQMFLRVQQHISGV